jgi:hypothetical protein
LSDCDLVTRGASKWHFAAQEDLPDLSTSPDAVFLLLSEFARISVRSPFGNTAVGQADSPSFLNLGRALAGTVDLCSYSIAPFSEAALFPSDDVRRLVFEPTEVGAAFRRLALRSLPPQLRNANRTLHTFFTSTPDDAAPRTAPRANRFAPGEGKPVERAQVDALFDAAGLDSSSLPELGLTCLTVPAGQALLSLGDAGHDAFFVASGKFRVSIRIPGVGEEAVGILGPGEIIGEMALIDDGPRSAEVVAHRGPGEVYVLSRAIFRSLMESGDPAGAALLGGIAVTLAKRLDEALRRVSVFRQLSGPG